MLGMRVDRQTNPFPSDNNDFPALFKGPSNVVGLRAIAALQRVTLRTEQHENPKPLIFNKAQRKMVINLDIIFLFYIVLGEGLRVWC